MLPEEVQQLKDRAKAAGQRGELHRSGLRTAYQWLDPAQYADMVGGRGAGDASEQGGVDDHIFDHTGPQSLEDGAGQIAEALHPQERESWRWVPRKDLTEDQKTEDLQEIAERRTNAAQGLMMRSNFYGEALKSHKEWLLGNGFLQVEKDPERRGEIRAAAIPAWVWNVERDGYGRLTGLFRQWKERAREVEPRFAPYQRTDKVTIPSEITRKAAKEPEGEVTIDEAYVRDVMEGSWRFVAWHGDDVILRSKPYRTCPIVAYASGMSPGRDYGYGPARHAVPTVRVCNKVVELLLKNASMSITGMWQADDDGVLNPATVQLVPGAIVPKAPGSNGLQPLEAPGRFDVSQLVLEDMRATIRRAMYVDKVDAAREMTATEYVDRRELIMRDLRGQYGVLKHEFMAAVVERVADLGEQMGVIQRTGAEPLLELELTGPLAEHVQQEEVRRYRMAVQASAETHGQELTMAAVKASKAIPWMFEEYGVDPEMVASESELQAFQEQVREMAAQMMAQQMAGVDGEQ
jgi:hypothetical protein